MESPGQGATPYLVVLAAATVFVGVFIFTVNRGGPRPPQPPSQEEVARRAEANSIAASQRAAASEMIRLFVKNGILTKWAASLYEAQVDPRLWGQIPVDTKKALILALQIDAGSTTAPVDVIDGYSGRKLASVGVFGDISFK